MSVPSNLFYYRDNENDLSGAGVDMGVTNYVDALQTIDPLSTGPSLGNNWLHCGKGIGTPWSDSAGTIEGIIGVSTQDSLKAALLSLDFGTATLFRVEWYPIAILNTNVFGKTQYCQFTFVKAGGVRAGVSVCGYPGSSYHVGYVFNNYNNTSWQLVRWTDVATYATVLASGTTGLANGDIYRISADQSVLGQVTLTVTKNGTVFQTYVDSTAPRLQALGYPCFSGDGAGGSGSTDIRTFSCGIGL